MRRLRLDAPIRLLRVETHRMAALLAAKHYEFTAVAGGSLNPRQLITLGGISFATAPVFADNSIPHCTPTGSWTARLVVESVLSQATTVGSGQNSACDGLSSGRKASKRTRGKVRSARPGSSA